MFNDRCVALFSQVATLRFGDEDGIVYISIQNDGITMSLMTLP